MLGSARRPSADRALLEGFAAHVATILGHRHLSRHALSLADRVRRSEAFEHVALPAESFPDLVARVESALEPLLGKVRAGISVADEDGLTLELVPGSFGAPSSVTSAYQIDLHDLRSSASRVFRLRRSYVSNDVRADPAMLQPYARAFGVERVISVPLVIAGRTLGLLNVANPPRPFTAEDLACCEEVAPRVGTAIEHLRLALRLRREHRIDRVISDATVAIAAGDPPDGVLANTLEEMRRVLGASAVAFIGLEGGPALARNGLDADAEADLLRQARSTEWANADPVVRGPVGKPGHAVHHTPVRLGGRCVGMISARRERAWAFRMDEQDGLMRLATVAALSFAASAYHDQRARLARIQERHRIADELHDDVAQLLFAAQMRLDALLELDDISDRVVDQARAARAHVVRGDAAIRAVIAELSPPGPIRVADRLEQIVQDVRAQFDLPVRLDVAPDAAPLLDEVAPERAKVLVKAAREALVNAAKHAGPCQAGVTVEATVTGRLRLRVTDDGIGLTETVDARGHGLAAMRRNLARHGGSLRVDSGDAGGTTVEVELALTAADRRPAGATP